MASKLLVLALLVGATMGGCLGSEPVGTTQQSSSLAHKAALIHKIPASIDGDLIAGPSLWPDPQNTPHPSYGWATLSSPANDPTASLWWKPIDANPLPDHITKITHLGRSEGVPRGAGIAIFGGLALVPEDAKTAFILDIRDPAHPITLSSFPTDGRGAAIIAYPNGRLIGALAGTRTITLVDMTDPTNPELLEPLHVNSHKLGVVPGTPILYNAGSTGGTKAPLYGPDQGQVSPTLGQGKTEIFDLTDPENPVESNFTNGYSCHHIFFWNSATKQRAICAGLQYTQIWDTKDPLHPTVIVSIPVHYGVANGPSTMASIAQFSHSAGINIKGNILYVGDENMGGGSPPGCIVGTETPVGDAGTPIGATWFYDISQETNPRLLGYFAPPRDTTHNTQRSCTTHHGRIVPDKEGRDLLAMSYYQDGVILIEFTGIGPGTLPKIVSEWSQGSDTWETWYNQGYLFTGDLARGLDTFKIQ